MEITDQQTGGQTGEREPGSAPKRIGRREVNAAMNVLMVYQKAKANLDQRIVENENWYRLRHWECMRRGKSSQVEPVSGWLFNAIANKHADAMDNFPSPNILPREEGDKPEAQMLSSIIPVVLEQADFEGVYDEVSDYKLKAGTGVYGVFWDGQKHNGLGDIAIRKIDIVNLFWEDGIADIQQSRNVFHLERQSREALIERYPEIRDRVTSSPVLTAQYDTEDQKNDADKVTVIDWYYKRWNGERSVLHYCKFVGDEVLYASENDPEYAERGFYDHGQYPFVLDPLFRMAGSICGFGYIDVAKSAQEYIDRGNQAILQNLLANVKPRYLIRDDGQINEAEYADMTKDFVHFKGNLSSDSVIPIQGKPLGGIYPSVINGKIDELKEVTGNRDISTGGSASGVTAASAIAAMQEAGSKLSRDNLKASYRAFRKVCLMVIELIRQFYDLPRSFRILGEQGAYEYVSYVNSGLRPEDGSKPVFDIEVSAQKASPYSKMAQNELALQFFNLGFFVPQMADQALATLDMMDFDGKSMVQSKIARGMTMQMQLDQANQKILELTAMLDGFTGENRAQALAQQMAAQSGGQPVPKLGTSAVNPEAIGGDGESNITKQARQRTAESTAPV